ncbi:hypothetical protein D0867_00957 [Hortaea werneckii]|uniref:Ferric oxidoreductase domain-containing protein n=1 Tax=Hortaea werneckii TaxID=91943 RepID=A0A3M7AC61_HORWE|nr:hypothetical protein D0867_00957 [Hortaea werneckii]
MTPVPFENDASRPLPTPDSVHNNQIDQSSESVEQPPIAPAPVHLVERQDEHAHHPQQLQERRSSLTMCNQSTAPSILSSKSSGLTVNIIETPSKVFQEGRTHHPGTYAKDPEDLESGWSSDNYDSKTVYEEEIVECSPAQSTQTKGFADRSATKEQIDVFSNPYPLPDLEGRGISGQLRYIWMITYRKLMVLTFAANIAAIIPMIIFATRNDGSFTYANAATATAANLTAAVLMRHEHFINLLFRIVCALPSWTPLQFRRQAAKVAYSQGGIHSAAGISALAWYIFYVTLLSYHAQGTHAEIITLHVLSALTAFMLVALIILALPNLRAKFHNIWELSHRFGGWTAIGLVWAQILISTVASARQASQPVGLVLAKTPAFWLLVVITLFLIYPWLWLRRVPVEAHRLSTHATELRFHNRPVKQCQAIGFAHRPLFENHKFATIPPPYTTPDSQAPTRASPGGKTSSYSVLVSNAGDWTSRLITSPPKHIWQRGFPTTGVMRVASLFNPVLIVATGSGIGPCLSFLNCNPASATHSHRVLWSARSPELTYGSDVVGRVFAADPEAMVIDTKKTGHPDLIALSWGMVQEAKAEAVVIISNPRVTKNVVFGLEARGVPAFGAIFDS